MLSLKFRIEIETPTGKAFPLSFDPYPFDSEGFEFDAVKRIDVVECVTELQDD